jgi:hypothetical protein
MTFTILLALSGLTLSAVAIYYSVIGLTAIFAAAFWPIVVMGTTLEVSKLVAASWLKANWERIPFLMKTYMLIAVVVLMLITSMGIFGFLSKAHTDQAVPLGDTAAKVAFIDEKINNERETITIARNLIKQLDDAVIGIQSGEGRELRNRDGSVRIENPAERALAVRRSQARDRAALSRTIDEAQARIVALQEEKAPIASQLRAVEAEVGPIKYIAKLIYGDDPGKNLLEKAVTWVIMVIVFVFDPLAVLLLLASQMTWVWYRKDKEISVTPDPYVADVGEKPTFNEIPAWEQDPPDTQAEGDSLTTESDQNIVKEATVTVPKDPHQVGWTYPKRASIVEYKVNEDADEEIVDDVFPKTPFIGQQVSVDDKAYIYNGTSWVEAPLSHSSELELEESKKKTYMIKEQNHQVKKTIAEE